MQQFASAPWPTSLKVTSAITSLLLLGVGYAATKSIPPAGAAHVVGWVVACVPPAIAAGAVLFVVSGYEIDRIHLRVRRLLWTTDLRLQGVSRIWHDPEAMKRSVRVVGNGGFFSFTGVFQSRKLGRYRAFVTDPKRAVALMLAGRVVVVSPADPDAFIRRVQLLFPDVEVGAGNRDV